MKRISTIFSITVVLFAAGCGGDSGASTTDVGEVSSGAGDSSAAPRAEMREVIKRLQSREQACEAMSEAFIRDSYGAGLAGRRKCERIAAKTPTPRVESLQFVAVGKEKGVIDLVDSQGNEARLILVKIGDVWLLNKVRSL